MNISKHALHPFPSFFCSDRLFRSKRNLVKDSVVPSTSSDQVEHLKNLATLDNNYIRLPCALAVSDILFHCMEKQFKDRNMPSSSPGPAESSASLFTPLPAGTLVNIKIDRCLTWARFSQAQLPKKAKCGRNMC